MSDQDESASTWAVRTEGLTRAFGALVAVDGLSLEVATGELFGLVGPDGAGKTTTLRMLAGVLPPSSGRAWVFGTDVGEDPEAVKERIAYMSQRFGLYHDLTVSENLDFYADLFGVPRDQRPERLARLYEFSGLGPYTDRRAEALSGGMKQKLGLSWRFDPSAESLAPGRADLRSGPDIAPGSLADHPRDGGRRRDRGGEHGLYGRGRAVRSAGFSSGGQEPLGGYPRCSSEEAGRPAALGARRESVEGGSGHPENDPVRLERIVFGERLHVVLQDATSDPGLVQTALESEGFSDVDVEAVEDPSLEDVFIDQVGAKGGPSGDGSGDKSHDTD